MARSRFDSYSEHPYKSIYVRIVGSVMCFLCAGWSIIDFVDLVDTRDLAAMEAFHDEPKDDLNVTVLEVGSLYIGTCGPAAGSCNVSAQVRDTCRSRQHLAIPPPASAEAASGRRLRVHDNAACQDRYVPWLLVGWTEDGRNVTRCAYEFGTSAGSIRVNAKMDETIKKLSVEHAVGSEMQVWAQKARDRCIVGYGSLDEELEYLRTHVTWGLFAIKLFIALLYGMPCAYFYFVENYLRDSACSLVVCEQQLVCHSVEHCGTTEADEGEDGDDDDDDDDSEVSKP